MPVKFGNNATTLLAANASSSTTTLTVDDGAVFPTLSGADYTYITLEDAAESREVVKLTAVSGNTLTVVRAQDGTSARAFAIADKCELRITAALLNGIAADINGGTTAGSFTTGTFSGEIAANGGIALGDSDKATFGAGDDLQIYHDGSNSYIDDSGTGLLRLRSSTIYLEKYTGELMADFNADGHVSLLHDNSEKFRTTSTGIDISGTATMDGLTVSGNVNIADAIPILRLDSPAVAWAGGEDLGGIDWYTEDASGDGPMVMARLVANSIGANTLPLPEFTFQTSLSSSALIDRLKIHNGGDISFFEDQGVTAKFFWDASEETLFVDQKIKVGNTTDGVVLQTSAGMGSILGVDTGGNGWNALDIRAGSATQLYLNTSGSVGIGNTAPTSALDVTGTVTADGLTVDGNPIINGTSPQIFLQTGASHTNWQIAAQENVANAFEISSGAADASAPDDTYTKRLVVQNNGDISFYEDTGTSPKFFWDASAESLGIGTISPTAQLSLFAVTGATNGITMRASGWNSIARAGINGTSGGEYILSTNWNAATNTVDSAGHATNAIIQDAVSGSIQLRTGTTNTVPVERMRIDSSGRVGIGSSAPTYAIDLIGGGNYRTLRIGNISATGVKRQAIAARHYTSTEEDVNLIGMFGDATTTTIAIGGGLGTIGFNSATKLEFHTAANNTTTATSAAMTIDDSGNLLISTTSAVVANSASNVGTAIGSGLIESARAGVVAQFNRHATDGSIIDLQKAGASVGSIGVIHGNNLFIGAPSHSGLQFGSSIVYPTGGSTGDANDATVDIGASGQRFKDLYLSGGVVFGTTGGSVTSKTLDDYEEGTWTPTIGAGGSNPTVGYVSNTGAYTKVGNLVTVFCTIITSSATGGSGHLSVDTLPFSVAAGQDGAVNMSFKYNWLTAPDGGACQASTSRAIFYSNIATNVTSTPADLTNGTNYLIFTASYRAA